MKIKIENGTLALVSGLTVKQLRKPVVLQDDKGNDTYAISYAPAAKPVITDNQLVCNTIVDGEAACVFLDREKTVLNALKESRSELMRAHRACAVAAANAAEDDAAFEEFWAQATGGEPVDDETEDTNDENDETVE